MLWKAEVLFNRSLCFAGMRSFDRALQDCKQSKKFSHSDSHLKRVSKLEQELKTAQENFEISEATTNSDISEVEVGSDGEESATFPSSPSTSLRKGSGGAQSVVKRQSSSKRDSARIVTVNKEARLKVKRPDRGPPAPPPDTLPDTPVVEESSSSEENAPVIQHRPSLACLEPPKGLILSPPAEDSDAPLVPSQPPPRKPRVCVCLLPPSVL